MKEVVIPYTTMSQARDLMAEIFPKKQIESSELISMSKKGGAVIKNIILTMKVLGLVSTNRKQIILTDEGIEFGRALANDNTVKMKEVIRQQIEKNDVLKFVLELLEKQKVLRIDEIGERLASRFNKSWGHPRTYSTYGASCADILDFAGYGYYVNGILNKEKIVKKEYIGKLSIPNASINEIKDICLKLRSEKKKLHQLSKELKVQDRKLVTSLSNCVIIGLIEKDDEGYTLSDNGINFVNPLVSEERKAEMFKKLLMKSPYMKLISELGSLKTEFITNDVGEFIAYELKREWGSITKKHVGKKFLNWLVYGKLVSKVQRGSYEIDKNLLNEIEEEIEKDNSRKNGYTRNSKFIEEKALGDGRISVIFELGKLTQIILDKINNKMNIDTEIMEFISLLETLPFMKDSTILLKSHFDIYKTINDYRIIASDLEFIEKKLAKGV